MDDAILSLSQIKGQEKGRITFLILSILRLVLASALRQRHPFGTNTDECGGPVQRIINDEIRGGTEDISVTYSASDQIIANNEITHGADVTFKAGNEILLNDGFFVEEGVEWHAFIEWCGLANFSPAQTNSNQYNEFNTTNQSKLIDDDRILIFPNPTSEQLNIQTRLNNPNGQILIYDISGAIIYKERTSKSLVNLNVGHLNDGLYFIKYINENESHISKFVISK